MPRPRWVLLALAAHAAHCASLDKQSSDPHSLAKIKGGSSREEAVLAAGDRHPALFKMQKQQPIGMRKMGEDEGEMFFLDYWTFDPLGGRAGDMSRVATESLNRTWTSPNPPLIPHMNRRHSNAAIRIARSIFKRDFQCPTGTTSCASIGQPNSCCSTTETCITVADTGLGPVGCCPQGQNCGGSVADCNTAEGFTTCPGSPNKGCCIPGFQCQGLGCVAVGTSIVSSTPVVVTVNPATSSPTTSVQTVTTTVVISPTTSADPTTITQTLTITPSTSTTSETTETTSTTVSNTDTSSTASAVAPVRPTSDSTTEPQATSVFGTPAATTADGCPTAFYRCSAYYVGGCCRVGRDCSSTSCPVGSSTTVVDQSGRTVVATAGASLATEPGTCATGWSACPATAGGGCCPSGYICGSATCFASAATQSSVAKEAPNAASSGAGIAWTLLAIAASSGMGMVLL